MALAMIRPLRKRKLVSRKYWGQTLLDGRMPKKGKRMMGSRAVTERGRASVHQYTAMSRMTNRQRPSCRGQIHAQDGQQPPGGQDLSQPHFAQLENGEAISVHFIGLLEGYMKYPIVLEVDSAMSMRGKTVYLIGDTRKFWNVSREAKQ